MSVRSFVSHISHKDAAKNALGKLDQLFGHTDDLTSCWGDLGSSRLNLHDSRLAFVALKTSIEKVAAGKEKAISGHAVDWMMAIEKETFARASEKDHYRWRSEFADFTTGLIRSDLIKGLGGKSGALGLD